MGKPQSRPGLPEDIATRGLGSKGQGDVVEGREHEEEFGGLTEWTILFTELERLLLIT